MSHTDDLSEINVVSGVNSDGEGFLTVSVVTVGGRIILGQVDPTKARELALAWLEAAEGAEQDAATLRVIRKLDLDDALAGMIISELRDSR